jgi:hypothetical protein
MDLLSKLQDPSYYAALMSGPGSELLWATCKVFERVSAAVAASYDSLTPGTSPLGEFAVGYVSLSRAASGGLPAGTLALGSMLWSITGERVVTLADATWAGSDASPIVVPVQSNRRSAQANLLVGTLLAIRSPVPSPIFDTTIMGAVADHGIALGGPADGVGLSGGVTPMLEALLSDRNMMVRTGESAAQARDRFRSVPDTVSPAAVLRQARIEIPTANLYEIADTCFAVNFSAVDQSWNLGAPNAGDRIYHSTYPVNAFAIGVPVQAVGDEFPLAANFGAVNLDAVSGVGPALMPDGTWYDAGSPGTRADIARLAARVDPARPFGSEWHIEEVS